MLSTRARASRKAFAKRYSRRTAAIVKLYALKRHLDWRSREISEKLAQTTNFRSVAATLANLTRGTYHPFADVDFWNDSQNNVIGNCKY